VTRKLVVRHSTGCVLEKGEEAQMDEGVVEKKKEMGTPMKIY
jgi:hypothetical protein